MIGVNYDLGFVTPMVTNTCTDTGANNGLKNEFLLIGATAPMRQGKLKAGYGQFDPAGDENLQQKFAIGHDYPLSKRTKLYGDFGTSRQKGKVAGVDYKSYNAYALGLQHVF
jgi:predicted porin